MTNTLNPHFLSEMLALPVRNLQDGTDYPHSGIFDMLHKGLKGSFAYKASVTDLDITQSDGGSFTQIVIAAGKVFRDGIMRPDGNNVVAADTILLDTSVAEGGFTTNGTSVTANQDVTPVSGGDVYLMVVVDASNILKIRGRNADINKAPMILTNDIPIAMIKMVADSADDAIGRPVQYFTTDKTANGLTLMYDNSGVAAVMGTMFTAAAGTTWQTLNDITIHNPTATTDLIIKDASNDAATGPSLTLKNERAGGTGPTNNDIAGTINFSALDAGDAVTPISSIVSKILNVAAGAEFADLRVSIANQNGTLVETLSLVGSAVAADVRVGINKAAPLSTLDIGGSLGVTLIHNTGTTATLDTTSSYVILDNGSPVAANLPAAVVGRVYYLKNNGGGQVTVNRAGSDTITMQNGATPAAFTLDQGHWATLIGAAGTWHLMQKGTIA